MARTRMAATVATTITGIFVSMMTYPDKEEGEDGQNQDGGHGGHHNHGDLYKHDDLPVRFDLHRSTSPA